MASLQNNQRDDWQEVDGKPDHGEHSCPDHRGRSSNRRHSSPESRAATTATTNHILTEHVRCAQLLYIDNVRGSTFPTDSGDRRRNGVCTCVRVSGHQVRRKVCGQGAYSYIQSCHLTTNSECSNWTSCVGQFRFSMRDRSCCVTFSVSATL